MPSFRHGFLIHDNLQLDQKFIGGYVYKCKKALENTTYLKCVGDNNNDVCTFRGRLFNGQLIVRKNHNHAPNALNKIKYEFEKSLFEAVTSDRFTPVRKIYDSISRSHIEAAVHVPFIEIQSRLHYWRNLVKPKIPNTLQDYINTIHEPQWENYLTYSHGRLDVILLEAEDESSMIVIYDLDFISKFNDVTKVCFDATFKIRPLTPKLRQVLSIMILIDGIALPVCWAMMEKKTKDAYSAILLYFKTYVAPNLNIQLIITDFEASLTDPVQNVFPNAVHVRCYFHFSQAVMKHIRSSGLHRQRGNVDHKIFTSRLTFLALLPAGDVKSAFFWILNNTLEATRRSFSKVIKYFYQQWIKNVTPEDYSVFGHDIRTNNFCEAYNKQLALKFGSHPNIWDFTECLQNLLTVVQIEASSLESGHTIRKKQRNIELVRNKIIKNVWHLYATRQMGVPQFFECLFSYFGLLKLNEIRDPDEYANEFIAARIDINLNPGRDITECIFCQRQVTNHICRPCGHWMGCRTCVNVLCELSHANQVLLVCQFCLNVVLAFETQF